MIEYASHSPETTPSLRETVRGFLLRYRRSVQTALAASSIALFGSMDHLDDATVQKGVEEKICRTSETGLIPFDHPEVMNAVNLWKTGVPVQVGPTSFHILPAAPEDPECEDRVILVGSSVYAIDSAKTGIFKRTNPSKCVERICRTKDGVRIEVRSGLLSKTVLMSDADFQGLVARLSEGHDCALEELSVIDHPKDKTPETITLELRKIRGIEAK